MKASIIIPFHANLAHLARSLPASRQSMPDAEIVVAADGARDDCRALAEAHGARVVVVDGPAGPATARNRAAQTATGDILLFVDADVVPAPDALPGLCKALEENPELAGVFGAYDLSPAEPNFMSQFRNLSHARVHERGSGEASTFWGALSAMRAPVFRSVGGFDERFRTPSVEDIELGCRLTAQGHRLRLDPRFRGTHLKRWTFLSGVATDLFARGIPWVQLIHLYGSPRNALNLRPALRASVVLAWLCAASLPFALLSRWALVVAGAASAGLVALNFDDYRWFARQRGIFFAARTIPVHAVHHLCNGVSFLVGTFLHVASLMGTRLPGAVPHDAWRSRAV